MNPPPSSLPRNGGTAFHVTAADGTDLPLPGGGSGEQRSACWSVTTNVMYYSGDSGATPALCLHRRRLWRGCHSGRAFWDGANIYVGTNDGLAGLKRTMAPHFALQPPCRHQEREVIVSFAGAKTAISTRFFAVTAASADAWAGVSGCELYGSASIGVIAWISGTRTGPILTANLPSGPRPRPSWAWAKDDISVAYLAGSDTQTGHRVYANDGQAEPTGRMSSRPPKNANIATGWSGDAEMKIGVFGECAEGFAVSKVNAKPGRDDRHGVRARDL